MTHNIMISPAYIMRQFNKNGYFSNGTHLYSIDGFDVLVDSKDVFITYEDRHISVSYDNPAVSTLLDTKMSVKDRLKALVFKAVL